MITGGLIMIMITGAFGAMKWEAFWSLHEPKNYEDEQSSLFGSGISLKDHDPFLSKIRFQSCLGKKKLKKDLIRYTKQNSVCSEVCQYLER